ncbi:MAG: hypothetical protein LBP68_02270 [Acidobacteriota bacterium]|nr:hypothetical protein [Acidobacteriota bacterium]
MMAVIGNRVRSRPMENAVCFTYMLIVALFRRRKTVQVEELNALKN